MSKTLLRGGHVPAAEPSLGVHRGRRPVTESRGRLLERIASPKAAA